MGIQHFVDGAIRSAKLWSSVKFLETITGARRLPVPPDDQVHTKAEEQSTGATELNDNLGDFFFDLLAVQMISFFGNYRDGTCESWGELS